MNDSKMSSLTTGQSSLTKIVANVVDQQEQVLAHFSVIERSIGALKVEHHEAIQSLREDLRRTDDRAARQVEELREAHSKEVTRLLDIIKTVLSRDSPMRPAQQAYEAAASPASFFSGPDPQMMHRLVLQQQNQQMQQQMQQHAQRALQQLSLDNKSNATLHSTQMQQQLVVPMPVVPATTASLPVQNVLSEKSPSAGTIVSKTAGDAPVSTVDTVKNVPIVAGAAIPASPPTTVTPIPTSLPTTVTPIPASLPAAVIPKKVVPSAHASVDAAEAKQKLGSEGFGDKWKMKEGEWECTGCYIRQSADDMKCAVCGTNKDGTSGEKNIFSQPCVPKPTTNTSKFSFGFAAASAAKEERAIPGKPAAAFGNSLTSDATKTVSGSTSSSAGIFGGAKSNVVTASSSTNASTFNFAPKNDVKPAASTHVPFSFKTAEPSATSPSPSSPFGSGKLLFGNSSMSKQSIANEKGAEDQRTDPPKSIFGSGANIASFAVTSQTSNIFEGDAAEKAKAQFAALPKSKLLAAGKPVEKAYEDDESAGEEEYEPDVDFQPVIPLPDLVEVKTGEEDEEVVFKARAKLYRFAAETKENKERGIGDIKILRNPATGKWRAVMRREQTHKLCANFNIIPAIKISPKPSHPTAYHFTCLDFAESAAGAQEVFTIKFKTEDIAQEFCEQFTFAQNAQ